MLTPEEQRIAAVLFEELIDLSPEERARTIAAYASREPSISPAVVAHVVPYVEELLELSARDWEPPAPVAPAPPELPRAGAIVGDYQLEEQVGEGGLGVVYRATRRVGSTESRVAIKFLRLSFDDSKTRERFELERQLLSELDHPGIAKLLDGGTSPAGLPYLAAEYVDGAPVTDYCDRLRLTIKQRLEIFLKICSAVEYAHQRQVLHRDLKPANILVTAEGAVKLLDFGIAKLLARKSSASPDLSSAGAPVEQHHKPLATPAQSPPTLPLQRMFSLSHASPEQIEGGPLAFSTDVYSLGIILYELLSGQIPFSGSALWDIAEARMTRRRTPTQPSELATEEAGAARRTQPAQLRKILRGELDAIARGTLAPDERERYSSVEALRLDVERFLAGLPVEVIRHGWPYRTRKWISRNRATSVVLLAAVCLMAWGCIESAVAQFRATRARLEEQRALAVMQGILFPGLLQMFTSVEPDAARTALLDTELDMLRREKQWPSNVQIATETQRLLGLRESAAGLWRMNRRAEAEQIVGEAIAETRALIDANPSDSEWDSFYEDALKRRIGYRTALGMSAEANQDSARLLEFEGRRVESEGTVKRDESGK